MLSWPSLVLKLWHLLILSRNAAERIQSSNAHTVAPNSRKRGTTVDLASGSRSQPLTQCYTRTTSNPAPNVLMQCNFLPPTKRPDRSKSNTSTICRKCDYNLRQHGKPTACEYCNIIAAFGSSKCQRCVDRLSTLYLLR